MGLLARYRSERVCPHCGSHDVARSRHTGLAQALLHYLFRLRAYRCLDCFRRYYGYTSAHRSDEMHHTKAA